MNKKPTSSMAQRPTQSARRSVTIPLVTLLLSALLIAVVGYTIGTRSNEIAFKVGPLLGLSQKNESLDTAQLETVYRQLVSSYDGKLDSQTLIDGATHGLVDAAGDKYTVYMSKKEADEFNKEFSGDIGGGIGAEIGTRNGQPTIIRILSGNPAESAGVKQGDILTSINGTSSIDWTSQKAANAIRGAVGTSVKLTVNRSGEAKEFSITRAQVIAPSVRSEIRGSTGIMTISTFNDQTTRASQKAADEFKSRGVSHVILDLRGNGGGSVDAAQAVAGLWLRGDVIATERTDGKIVDRIKATGSAPLKGLKTVVLVDGNSASASEIVAGALHDLNIATLIGQKTFGKGTVQQLIPLNNGAQLKVTIARWYTPNGKNITGQGIVPDTLVSISDSDYNNGKDPQLDAAVNYLVNL